MSNMVTCTSCGANVKQTDLPTPSVPMCKFCQVKNSIRSKASVGRGFLRTSHKAAK